MDGNERQTPPQRENATTRKDWEVNQLCIEEGFFKLVAKLKRCPTWDELAAYTGLSVSSVRRHLDAIDLTEARRKVKSMTERVLLRATDNAMGGDSRDIKLWMQLVHDWSEKKILKIEKAPGEFSDEDLEDRIQQLAAKTGITLAPRGEETSSGFGEVAP